MRPVTRVLLRTSWTMSIWSKTSLKAEKEKWRGSPASCGVNARNNVHTTGPRVKKAATPRMTSVPRLAGSRRRRGAAGGARTGSEGGAGLVLFLPGRRRSGGGGGAGGGGGGGEGGGGR